MRLLADVEFKAGDRLELELSLPDQARVRCTAEVVWAQRLSEGTPAACEVGVKFASILGEDMLRLLAAVEQG
jgi:hypothetical protein